MFDSIIKLNNLIAEMSSILGYSKYTPKVHILKRLIKARTCLDTIIQELQSE
jgi:hypothetical protein